MSLKSDPPILYNCVSVSDPPILRSLKRSRVGVRSHPLSNSMSKGMSAIAIRLTQESLYNSEMKLLWFLTNADPNLS